MPPSLSFLSGLTQYGPIGLILLAFLLLFLKLFNRMIDNLISEQAKHGVFMAKCLEALHEIKLNCIQCRNETVSAAGRARADAEERVLIVVRSEVDRAIEQTQRDNDLSRPTVTPSPVRQPYPPVAGMVKRRA
jgi:hypothetical protein